MKLTKYQSSLLIAAINAAVDMLENELNSMNTRRTAEERARLKTARDEYKYIRFTLKCEDLIQENSKGVLK